MLRGILRSLEFKLIVSWLVVVLFTIAIDQNRSYLNYPVDCSLEIVRQTILLGIFALGAAVIIISGGIDLSSGAVVALSSTVFAGLMRWFDPVGFDDTTVAISVQAFTGAAAGTLILGFFVGTFHAWLITKVGLPPFVATLATLVGLRSLARGIAKLSSESGQINLNEKWVKQLLTSPWTLIVIFAVLVFAFWILMSKSVLGRRLHAMGGNEQATLLCGIRTDRLKWFAYCLGSMTACLTGILFLGETSAAKPESDAVGYELNAIAAAVIGGCSLKGGIGTIPGAALGCLFLSTVIDAIGRIIGTDSKIYEGLIVGIVVVLAVTFSQRERIARRYFQDALGWMAIPFLTLLAAAVSYFFTKQTVTSLGIGGATLVALVGRAIWETKTKST